MSRDPRSVLLKPLMTEKSMQQKEELNAISFRVAVDANKVEIRHAVEKLWSVSVLKVRTAVVRGKQKRLGRFTGRRSAWKKALVTLAPGQNVEFFEGV